MKDDWESLSCNMKQSIKIMVFWNTGRMFMLGCLIDVIIKITNTNVRMDDNDDAHVHVIYADCADSGLAILYPCILWFGNMRANYKVNLTSRFLLKSLTMTRWLGQTLASVNSHEFGNDFGTSFKVVHNGPNCNLLFCGFWSSLPSNTV